MNRKKAEKILGFGVICGLLFLGIVSMASAEQKIITWNVSLWGSERDWTRPLHAWVKDMENRTDGRWRIKLHYGAVLAPDKEQLDGLKAGLFEACQFCAGYAPGKTLLHTVHELPFILPENSEHICLMVKALWEHPAIRKEFDTWKAVPLIPATTPQDGLMSTKPIRTVKDFNGLRIRIPGEHARILRMFGAVPTMVPASDMYEAMARGTVDALTTPWPFAFGSFRIYEVANFATPNFLPGSKCCAYVVNKDSWAALPDQFKKIHREWYENAAKIWAAEYRKGYDKWIPIFKKKGIEFIDLPTEDRAKLIGKASIVYEEWIKRVEKTGRPGKDVFDYFMAKRKEIAGF